MNKRDLEARRRTLDDGKQTQLSQPVQSGQAMQPSHQDEPMGTVEIDRMFQKDGGNGNLQNYNQQVVVDMELDLLQQCVWSVIQARWCWCQDRGRVDHSG